MSLHLFLISILTVFILYQVFFVAKNDFPKRWEYLDYGLGIYIPFLLLWWEIAPTVKIELGVILIYTISKKFVPKNALYNLGFVIVLVFLVFSLGFKELSQQTYIALNLIFCISVFNLMEIYVLKLRSLPWKKINLSMTMILLFSNVWSVFEVGL